MKYHVSTGMRAQYQELVDSAKTMDRLVREYSDTGRAQEHLKNNDIFEIHMANIRALHDYKMKTGNVAGTQYVSGRGQSLMPAKIAEKSC